MTIYIVLIISFIAAIAITNGAQQLFMKVMGVSGMFFSMRKKLIVIVVITFLLTATITYIFGIEIPNSSTPL